MDGILVILNALKVKPITYCKIAEREREIEREREREREIGR